MSEEVVLVIVVEGVTVYYRPSPSPSQTLLKITSYFLPSNILHYDSKHLTILLAPQPGGDVAVPGLEGVEERLPLPLDLRGMVCVWILCNCWKCWLLY